MRLRYVLPDKQELLHSPAWLLPLLPAGGRSRFPRQPRSHDAERAQHERERPVEQLPKPDDTRPLRVRRRRFRNGVSRGAVAMKTIATAIAPISADFTRPDLIRPPLHCLSFAVGDRWLPPRPASTGGYPPLAIPVGTVVGSRDRFVRTVEPIRYEPVPPPVPPRRASL